TSTWRTAVITVGNSYNTAAYTLTQGPGTIANPTADQVVYYHTDAIGSVRLLTDATGATIAGSRRDYLPFGELWGATMPTQDERSFAGKERDKETTLGYFGARYYGNWMGRFTTIDPKYTLKESLEDPQRWNRYTYVRNNP